jgi:DNA-directed RNA polymerase subunit RPC12/RpoP
MDRGRAVGESMAGELFDADLDVPCPACGYSIWVRVVEVVAGTAVLCPACRCRVWLVDAEGSVQNMTGAVENAVNDLMQSMKGLFG